jgi:putative ABC transport system ATP-binding protein
MTTPRIACRSLVKRLPSGETLLTVLDGVDLSIDPGECVAVLGPSGSGKSTLLGLLAGLDRPTSGSVIIDGTDLGTLDEDGLALLRRRAIGFVFQSFQLLGNLTARENVLLPLELAGVDDALGRADELLAAVGLSERGHHFPSQLSGGEQQRVAIARAFGPRPPILLADEPTGNLDGDTGARILDLMFDLRAREGTTMVLVTHDPALALRAGRAVRMADGSVVEETAGDPAAATATTGGGASAAAGPAS